MIKWIKSWFEPSYIEIQLIDWTQVKTVKELTTILNNATISKNIVVTEEYLEQDPKFKKYCKARKLRM